MKIGTEIITPRIFTLGFFLAGLMGMANSSAGIPNHGSLDFSVNATPQEVSHANQEVETLGKIKEIHDRVFANYKVEINFDILGEDSPLTTYTETNAVVEVGSLQRRLEIAKKIENTLSVYPPSLFQSILINRDALVILVFDQGGSTELSEKQKLPVGRIIKDENDVKMIILNDYYLGNTEEAWWEDMEEIIHHEICNSIQFMMHFEECEDDFINLNPDKKLAYAYDYDDYLPLSVQDKKGIVRGFAYPYGKTHPWDDMATIIQLLLTNSHRLAKQAKNDSILSEKVKFTKKFYERVSGGEMDEKYWQDLQNGLVTVEYFNNRQKQ